MRNWFRSFRWFGLRRAFVYPRERNLTLEQMFKYWRGMRSTHKAECEWYVYRLDPAKAPFDSLLKFRALPEQAKADKKAFGVIPPNADVMRRLAAERLGPSREWWDSQDPDMERRIYFLARIMRRWLVYGAERHEEICVAAFNIEAAPDSLSCRYI